MGNKWIISAVIAALVVAFLAWLFIESSKPLPGEKIADLGRDHVPIGENVEYNSNPPTSGKHYEEWIRAGVYEEEKDDRNLVHSLEHGYVIMSYNCDKKISNFKLFFKLPLAGQISNVYAHGIEEEVNQSTEEATGSSGLSDNFRSEECHNLVDQLISIYEKKGKTRIIVLPRPNLDSRIALTAWNYIDKFDVFDQERIEKFIDTHLNQGPEKTME